MAEKTIRLRKRGRPRRSWIFDVEEAMEKHGIEDED